MKPTDEQAGAWTEAFDEGKFMRKTSEFRDFISKDGTFDVEVACQYLHLSRLSMGTPNSADTNPSRS